LQAAKPRRRNLAFTVMTVTCGSLIQSAFASDPSYDEKYNYRFEAVTGYPLSEDGVREALDNFDELGYDEKRATIAIVGEQRYTSLVNRIKAIYLREPLPKFVESDQANIFPGEIWNHPRFLDILKTHAVRALIRCGDPDAGELALREAARAKSMSITSLHYAVRNLKYLVKTDSEVDVVAALKSLVDNDQTEHKHVSRAAVRELAELEHYLRRSADARRAACSDVLDEIMEGDSPRLRGLAESYRNSPRPGWSDTHKLHMPAHVYTHDYPLLDAMMDYVLGR